MSFLDLFKRREDDDEKQAKRLTNDLISLADEKDQTKRRIALEAASLFANRMLHKRRGQVKTWEDVTKMIVIRRSRDAAERLGALGPGESTPSGD